MVSSLRVRLMIAVGLLAVAAVVAVGITVRQRTRHEFRHFLEVERSIANFQEAGAKAELIASEVGERCCSAETLRAVGAMLPPNQAMIVVGENNKDRSGNDSPIVARAGGPLEALSEMRVKQAGGVLTISADRRAGDSVAKMELFFQVAGVAVTLADGRSGRLYVLNFPKADPLKQGGDAFLGSLDRSLLVAIAVVAALALPATWSLTRRIAGPIEELRAAAGDLAQGNLARRVGVRGSDEIAGLSRSFNAMAGEMERQRTLRRNLVDDVVHELRTPLTALRCRVDAVMDGMAKDPQRELAGVDEEVEHLSRLIDDLQELALAEAHELKLTLGEVAAEPVILSAARAAGLDRDARLRVEAEPGLMAYADSVRLRQVVLNILTNAARHTPEGGEILVRAWRQGSETLVEVHNSGSTLNEEEARRVFDRFYRADPSRQRATGGSGLGLAIVKHLVEAQSGRVWASAQGNGVTVSFALPAARAGA